MPRVAPTKRQRRDAHGPLGNHSVKAEGAADASAAVGMGSSGYTSLLERSRALWRSAQTEAVPSGGMRPPPLQVDTGSLRVAPTPSTSEAVSTLYDEAALLLALSPRASSPATPRESGGDAISLSHCPSWPADDGPPTRGVKGVPMSRCPSLLDTDSTTSTASGRRPMRGAPCGGAVGTLADIAAPSPPPLKGVPMTKDLKSQNLSTISIGGVFSMLE